MATGRMMPPGCAILRSSGIIRPKPCLIKSLAESARRVRPVLCLYYLAGSSAAQNIGAARVAMPITIVSPPCQTALIRALATAIGTAGGADRGDEGSGVRVRPGHDDR